MATSNTTSIQSASLPPEADLETVSRCVGDHAQALLMVLASAGDAWDAGPAERRILSRLVGHRGLSHQQAAGQ